MNEHRKNSSALISVHPRLNKTIGLYLHIPFCLSKCGYCDFASWPLEYSGTGVPPVVHQYLNALNIELDLRAFSLEFHSVSIDTIYFGGGTPTVLPEERLAELLTRIRNRFDVKQGAEITAEANPGTLTEQKLSKLLGAGFNRLSLGVQSFSDQVLRILGRAHNAVDARDVITLTRSVGCTNLGIDLMYGVPGQSVTEWKETLLQAVALEPDHVSVYALSLEAGTPLADAIEAGRLCALSDEYFAEMYTLAREILTNAGYRHYEISNFARPGFECWHNRRYWAGDEYLGVGVSAHSHRAGVRWNNTDDLSVYMNRLERGTLPTIRAERLSARQGVGETIVLGLRCAEGANEEAIADRFGVSPREVFEEEINQLCEQGVLAAVDGRLVIPPDKWLISNEIMAHFVA